MDDEARHRSPLDRLVAPLRDAILHQVDPDELIGRLDVNAVLARVDVNALLDRVDVNALLDRVDVNALLDRVDVDRLIARVDVDRLIANVDIDRLIARTDVDAIVASSTGRVAGSLVDVVRRQLVGLDAILLRTIERVRGIDPRTVPDGPPLLTSEAGRRGRYDVSGRYAGPLSRLAANVADVAAAFGLFTLLSAGLAHLGSILLGGGFTPQEQPGSLWWVSLSLVLFLYLWLSTAIAGRTPAMGVFGLRVVARDGRPLTTARAAIRTLSLPVSLAVFGLGFLGLLLGRERRGLHDVLGGSAVVYDWGDRPASLPTPLGDWLSRHEPDLDAVGSPPP
jgi:uncharacterized RDD family membrane protein YckC